LPPSNSAGQLTENLKLPGFDQPTGEKPDQL